MPPYKTQDTKTHFRGRSKDFQILGLPFRDPETFKIMRLTVLLSCTHYHWEMDWVKTLLRLSQDAFFADMADNPPIPPYKTQDTKTHFRGRSKDFQILGPPFWIQGLSK
jgi:hypothetical protein